VYYDDWTGAFLPAIRQRVAAALGVQAGPEAGLLALCQASHQTEPKGLILVLDQFEQFFVRHEGAASLLGRELGELCRSAADAHVVLALREEYLARLTALRAHLMTIDQGLYRVKGLDGQQASDAIRGPLQVFNATIDDDLVERLLGDLREKGKALGLIGVGADYSAVSLPLLQIVCERLWKASAPTRKLTVTLYDGLGGGDAIVESYVDEALGKLPEVQRLDTARVLRPLAPRAGIKMAYPVEELVSLSGLDAARVETVLGHLEGKRIVRRREDGAIVELYHDAFTRVLRRFIDDELRHAETAAQRARLWRRWAAGLLLVVLLGLSIAFSVFGNNVVREQQLAVKPLGNLDNALQVHDCSLTFDAVRRVLAVASERTSFPFGLFRPPREELLQALASVLRAHEPSASSCSLSLRGPVTPNPFLDPSAATATYVLKYNVSSADGSGPGLEENLIRDTWRRYAQDLWSELKVPLPEALIVRYDTTLPLNGFVLIQQDQARKEERVVVRRDLAAMGIGSTEPRVGILLQDVPAEFLADEVKWLGVASAVGEEPARTQVANLHFRIVPAWSSPLWLAARESLLSNTKAGAQPPVLDVLPAKETAIAVEAVTSVAAAPSAYSTLLLSQARLLTHAKQFPSAIASLLSKSACRRSEKADQCFQRLFSEIVPRVHGALFEAEDTSSRTGRPARLLDRVLDRLADYPNEPPESIAKNVLAGDFGFPPPGLPLHGPDPWSWMREITATMPEGDYRDLAAHLDAQESWILVRFDPTLVDRIRSAAGGMSIKLVDALMRARRSLDLTYGALSGNVNFRGEGWSYSGYQIEVRGAPGAPPSPDSDWTTFSEQLERAIERSRLALITADAAREAVELLAPNLRNWIMGRFSPNDLKVLLRAVLAPGDQDSTGTDGHTIARLPWLLGSLPYWAMACPHGEDRGTCIAIGLQETQRQRRAAGSPSSAALDAIEQGIAAIERDDIDGASRSFGLARKADPERADRHFTERYAARAVAMLISAASTHCVMPPPGGDKDPTGVVGPFAIEADEAVDLLAPGTDKREKLQLCSAIAHLGPQLPTDQADLLRPLARATLKRLEHWSANDLYWLGYFLFADNASTRNATDEDRRLAHELLVSAFGALGTGAHRLPSSALPPLMGRCYAIQEPELTRCMFDLVDIANDASLELDSLARLLNGWKPSEADDTPEHAKAVRRLLQRLREAAATTPPAFRKNVETQIDVRLMMLDVEDARRGETPSERVLTELEGISRSAPSPLGQLVGEAAAGVYHVLGDDADVARVLDQGLARWKDDSQLNGFEYTRRLGEGRLADAIGVAERIRTLPGMANDGLFRLVIARLLSGDGDLDAARRLLHTDHVYRDYARLLLWWRLMQNGASEEASGLLSVRLLEAQPDGTRAERLSEGDLAPWRDMLIAHIMSPEDDDRRRDVFEPLDDPESFRRSALAGSAQSFKMYRSEAFFYEALLQSVTGDPGTRSGRFEEFLQRVIDERCSSYENAMARYLLRRTDGSMAAVP
jgi:hypothetical protein